MGQAADDQDDDLPDADAAGWADGQALPVPNRHRPPTHPPRNAHQQEARRLKNQAKRRRLKKSRTETANPSPKGTAP